MANELTGWQPDPYGVHELRYFAANGLPTRLVRDGAAWSHDEPPVAVTPSTSSATPIDRVKGATSPSESTHFDPASVPAPPPRSSATTSTAQGPIKAPPSVHGWQPDPFQLHEERYFTRGDPTRLVRDAGRESYDEVPETQDEQREAPESFMPTPAAREEVFASRQQPIGPEQLLDPSEHHVGPPTDSSQIPPGRYREVAPNYPPQPPHAGQMARHENRNKALIQKAFDDWTAGTGGLCDLASDDSTWTITGTSPVSNTFGHRQFMEAVVYPFQARLATPLIPFLHAIYGDGETVIALFDGQANTLDGGSYFNTYSMYITLTNDRIVRTIVFFDSIAFTHFWQRVVPNR
jgi:uncharacterized protein